MANIDLKEQAKLMTLFDTRLYRKLSTGNDSGGADGQIFYPMFDYGSYVSDWHESAASLDLMIQETEAGVADGDQKKEQISALKKQKEGIQKFNKDNENSYLAPRSLIHPYAIVKLAGASGNPSTLGLIATYDLFQKRRFYEIDGDNNYSGHYAKNPTTTTLIKLCNESEKGKTPYSFQDFVFCKWWNKIENNRLITLRRYASPVTDAITFKDYYTSEVSGSTDKVEPKYGTKPYSPLATAVTYFGKETGNDLSKILAFSAQYNWDEADNGDNKPISVSSTQNDAGAGLVNGDAFAGIASGLGGIARFMGVLGDIQNGKTLNMDSVTGVPPDPYSQGPYSNRILGPINVITKVAKRKRGLTFKQDGLKIVFEYVARPIAGINNKAVLLDLLANILVLCYSSGSWFGGMHRYEVSGKPALYPWKYGDVMNKMHRGELFGKNGAVSTLTQHVFGDGKSLIATFLPDVSKMLKGLFDGAVNAVKSFFGDSEQNKQEKEQASADFSSALETGTAKTIQKLIAAKATRGTSIPYISGNRALLTGEPVGDWHLTIGNPLNPIAMIGNLIVKDLNIEFQNELGPDDFPIGFKATVTLAHGLGRDRDAIESMFNRGFGRIYTLPAEFRSSADGETKVDNFTGTDGKERVGYEEIRQTYYGGGSRGIMDIQKSALSNSGVLYDGYAREINALSLIPTKAGYGKFALSSFYINPWQMAMNM